MEIFNTRTVVLIMTCHVERDSVKRSRIPYILLIPFFLDLVIFSFFTLGFGVYISFTDWRSYLPLNEAKFVGLANYITAVTGDPVFLLAIKNAFVYVLYEPITILIGFFLALLLNSAVRGRSIFRTIFFIPVITSTVAISFVWGWLYNFNSGPFNSILRYLHLPPQYWLGTNLEAIPSVLPMTIASVMLMSIWQWIGLNVIIFLAGLQSIPKEYHEAARISGAGTWGSFRHVTVPLLKPTLLFVILTATAGSLQVFTEVFMLSRVSPGNITMVPVQWMYQNAFSNSLMGYGAAMSWTFFLVVLAVALVEIWILRRGGIAYY